MNYNEKKEILLNLKDIKEYTRSAIYYLNTFDSKNDKEEIVMYLSSIPELVNELICWINKKYETCQKKYDLLENCMTQNTKQFTVLVQMITSLDLIHSDTEVTKQVKQMIFDVLEINQNLANILIELEETL